MKIRRYSSPLLALLALSTTLVLAAPAHAQYGRDSGSNGTSATLRVNFGTSLHWTGISGTHVEELPTGERSGYDMFRYGGSYYAYDNDRWYMSPRESGDFRAIDDSAVPTEFSSIPRDHWRNYPSQWQGRRYDGPRDTQGSFQVTLGNSQRWTGIRGTRVREIRQGQRPDYDMFSYGGRYYVYSNDRWYASRSRNGHFYLIADRDVPREFSSIPASHWHNYPAEWQRPGARTPGDMHATMQVSFGSTPRWNSIHGTRVREIRSADRPDYDMFGYDGSYYVYNNNRWYSSRQRTGEFTEIDERSLPSAFTEIPRDHWRNYPSGWQDSNGDRR